MRKDNPTDRKYSGLRNVTALGIVSFFTDFSTEMILGNLPIYLMSEFGASRAIVGAVEGSAELTGYALRIVPGSLSDRIGRRKIFVVIGYSISTITKPFFAFAANWMEIFAARTADRVGKAVREAPRDALISDSVHESISGKAFGIHRSIDQLGAIAGPVAAFALLEMTDIRSVFLFSVIPGIIAVVILAFFVKEIAVKTPSKDTLISNIRTLVRNNKPFFFC
jgi:MFS family permease